MEPAAGTDVIYGSTREGVMAQDWPMWIMQAVTLCLLAGCLFIRA